MVILFLKITLWTRRDLHSESLACDASVFLLDYEPIKIFKLENRYKWDMIDFNRLIDQFLHRELKPKEIGRYYPSEIGMCMRKLWYSYKFPKEVEADLI